MLVQIQICLTSVYLRIFVAQRSPIINEHLCNTIIITTITTTTAR
jgi:hypothetical protein